MLGLPTGDPAGGALRRQLGFTEPFLGTVADAVIDVMGGHYTDLVEKAASIKRTITREEERFRRTVDRGLSELDAELAKAAARRHALRRRGVLPEGDARLAGQVTKDIVEERGYTVDLSGFASAEQEHALVSGGGKKPSARSSRMSFTTRYWRI
ncbi:MAG: alanine--tRNA ligase-related protein [Anaerolineae bacterium]